MRDGKERKLQAGRDAGLVEDIRQMALDCFFAEAELFGDIAVAAAFYDAADDFEFARREAVGLGLRRRGLLHQVVQGRNEIDDALATDPIIAGGDSTNGGLEMTRESVFENDTARADVQSFDDLLGGDGGGEQKDLDRG